MRRKKVVVVPSKADTMGGALVLSVMNAEQGERKCAGCGQKAICFNAMDCRRRVDGGQSVIQRCKACLGVYAEQNQIEISVSRPAVKALWSGTKWRERKPKEG